MDSRDPVTLALLCAEVLDCAIAARQVSGAPRVSQIDVTKPFFAIGHRAELPNEDRYFVDDADLARPE